MEITDGLCLRETKLDEDKDGKAQTIFCVNVRKIFCIKILVKTKGLLAPSFRKFTMVNNTDAEKNREKLWNEKTEKAAERYRGRGQK